MPRGVRVTQHYSWLAEEARVCWLAEEAQVRTPMLARIASSLG